MVRVETHAWYSYGASTTADRDVRPSNALQWDMIQLAYSSGCQIYDLRGIADTLNPDNHLFGLVQFKVGTSGFAQEYLGEWDYILRSTWSKAYGLYQSRRG
jgi:lipid II:glycine glycyltransferase (peptidoglycan interpeptide bridge formation enzyme)